MRSSSSNTGSRVKAKASKSISRSKKTSLKFTVGSVAHYLKVRKYADRLSVGAPIYLFVVLEYVAAKVLELARNAVRNYNKSRIAPRHIQLVVNHDKELSNLLKSVTIASGDMVPNIHQYCLLRMGM